MCNKIRSCYIFMLNLETDGAWKFLNQMEIPLPSNQSGLQFLFFFCKEAQNSEWLECSFNKITFLKKKYELIHVKRMNNYMYIRF